jgi:hypothetical protein
VHRSSAAEAGQAPLPARAEAAKTAGNRAFFERAWPAAVAAYSAGISCAPGSALLRANRAAALLARAWQGDAWAALEDCEGAIALAPGSAKPRYRRIQALQALGLLEVLLCSLLHSLCLSWALYWAVMASLLPAIPPGGSLSLLPAVLWRQHPAVRVLHADPETRNK